MGIQLSFRHCPVVPRMLLDEHRTSTAHAVAPSLPAGTALVLHPLFHSCQQCLQAQLAAPPSPWISHGKTTTAKKIERNQGFSCKLLKHLHFKYSFFSPSLNSTEHCRHLSICIIPLAFNYSNQKVKHKHTN